MIIYIIIFILIIAMPQIAFSGTINGLKLWALKVLPGLFPAFIISYCIIRLIPKNNKSGLWYIIMTGIFCGFPAGAISCSTYCDKFKSNSKDNSFDNEKIKFLDNILYCINISSPAFIINYVYIYCLSGKCNIIPFMTNIYLPVIILLLLHFAAYKNAVRQYKSKRIETKDCEYDAKEKHQKILPFFDEGLNKAVSQCLKLGGYIVFYSCVASFVTKLSVKENSLFEIINSISVGIIEITNGLSKISLLNIDFRLKYVFIMAVNCFGGLSTLAQTYYLINDTGISIKKYIYHKIILTVLTTVLSLFMAYVLKII